MSIRTSIFFLPISLFILTGCDDNINNVKSTVYSSLSSTLNIGDAFKSRKDCIDGEWKEKKDSRERIIVSYECQLPKKYIYFYNNKQIKEISDGYALDEKIADDQISMAKSNIVRYKQLKTFLEERKEDVANLINKSIQYQNKYGNSSTGIQAPVELNEAMYNENYKHMSKNEFCNAMYDKYKGNENQGAGLVSGERCDFIFDIRNIHSALKEKSALNDKDMHAYVDYPISMSLPNWAAYDASPQAGVEKYYKKHDENLEMVGRVFSIANNKLKIYQDIKENIKNYSGKLGKNISLNKATSTTQWFVTKTGGVELMDSYLTFYLDGKDYKYTFKNPMTTIEMALHDFSDDQIPSIYISSMENYFRELKRSLRFDIRGECRDQFMPC
ncbi:hypothetical protein KGP26_00770 [Serratia sp. JSRIV002]|uniref:hypothetical protein n=1 Tax=Serratia sp. JSRIV002 TaxID=2831894 RepID=UPI001CBFBDBC|nr:hypothetical protein [Serratia sp. JSRIV002]UAN51662.1 hypothetical protein KGP26_00770 [Serratia sp. JSRIV002]